MLRIIFSVAFILFLITSFSIKTHAQVIYETKSGDTLSEIAQTYHTTTKIIASINGLKSNAHLVKGQALVIPGATYVVQHGESIYGLATRHGITSKLLMSTNRLKSTLIIPGQKLTIPLSPKMDIWTGSYLVPSDERTNSWLLGFYQPILTSVFVFDYHPDNNGQLSKLNDNQAHMTAWKKNLIPYATITNQSEKGYDPDLVHHLLSDPTLTKAFINNIYSLLDNQDYKGVVIDFETVRPEDKENLNKFIAQLAELLHRNNMEILMAFPPMTGDGLPAYYGGYDYKALSKYLDKMFLMTYNWHWLGGQSGPIAPIEEIRTVLKYAVSVVPKSKIMLGIPQYAYDWTISGNKRTGKAYSIQGAINQYINHESEIFYDQKTASPWFRYKDKEGAFHEVWFEDPRSLIAKLRLVKDYGLGGMGCWQLGTSIPQTKDIMNGEFNVQTYK